ncbi:DUF5753 domain-containing protein [Streptomyces sp. NPDC058470]|uniref:DUF5753 domain-containing protein n=1 Tax=Streptomyces sp. NPDC058470 TaxID=3346515 RepID=UPI00364F5181
MPTRLSGERPLQFHATIWEAALRQQVGGPAVMRTQLEHLLEVSELPNVLLRVLPFHAGAHACIAGPFSILSFAEDTALDVVQSDTITGMLWVENDMESSTYSALFERTARLSLTRHDSFSLIHDLRKEM